MFIYLNDKPDPHLQVFNQSLTNRVARLQNYLSDHIQ